MCIIENGVRIRSGRPFYYRPRARNKLELDMDWTSNLAWTLLTPKVVANEEDVLGHLLGVLHLLGACSNLGLGPNCE
jgi:hypothetical protein